MAHFFAKSLFGVRTLIQDQYEQVKAATGKPPKVCLWPHESLPEGLETDISSISSAFSLSVVWAPLTTYTTNFTSSSTTLVRFSSH